MIEVHDLKKEYPMGDTCVKALNGVSFSIAKNEFVAIMGPSGSGKSTLMNIIGCLDKPSSGGYSLNEQEVAQLDDDALSAVRNKEIGFVFQSFHLLPRLSALQNVLLPLRFSDHPDQDPRYAHELLARVGLETRHDHRPNQLSGGQRQRVAIARSLVNRPAILLADEPTGALDSKTSVEIMALFTELHKAGQTIILVTHEEEVAAYAQRIIRMRDGDIVEIEERATNAA
ncbi:macrolide ABC transporter ATP-binding protein [Shewanella sp. Choline-02u-19]|jgi:putative ABC transport system ATP-binding protein|uniref:ABC transporter ATP-binding protein n=1 Tax=unclassified Shewanella TaxID=196818 RepID=UPI000C33301E|nr:MULTISPECIES: ABC transporter ATP-binding protein [unclassified Shewanella]PKG56952.1 macrolide ABC transporter ATP-binding protein [Shewanella sp. GutDb-MelDb]PKG72631.1 macrolide ABC transporter ATP-binding protein [Shewanella sp. GutCb]PKH56990.1 macrolide ABC transporter ATP-binding protein [Shewanella sp. Bg11-22]PKI27787.1 macrolide ABC transporter ATP-binding protein [Shewanella sp. Choline-02u-19]